MVGWWLAGKMEGMKFDPFCSRIPPRPTWFHKDPEIALSELVMGGYRRVEEWRLRP